MVKYHVFKVPGKTKDGINVDYQVRLIIEGLSEHFYPMVFLKKIDMQSKPVDFTSMQFPTIIDYDLVFGENPYQVLSKQDFDFAFRAQSTETHSYYTMAVFEHNWGLTDDRKSEY